MPQLKWTLLSWQHDQSAKYPGFGKPALKHYFKNMAGMYRSNGKTF